MTKMISFRITDDLAVILDEQVKQAGIGRTDYLIGLISESVPVVDARRDEPTDEDQVRQARAAKKEARRGRKAELATGVAAALPPREVRVAAPVVAVGGCIHPSNQRRGSMTKFRCLACGAEVDKA